MGHVLLTNGISPNQKSREGKNMACTQKYQGGSIFLGLASYYRQFINKYAKRVWCPHELVTPISNKHKENTRTRKNITTGTEPGPRIFKWMKKHQDAFDALKETLSTAPVLGYPDFSREFILDTNACLNGLGAVLSHQGKKRETHVIAYASHSLTPSERSMGN